MTALLVCALIAATALAWTVSTLASEVWPARWPEKEREHVEDDRSHDHRLADLARQLGMTNLSEAHRTFVDLAERCAAGGQALDPEVSAFLVDPPLAKPHRYRHKLDKALTRLEQS